MEHYIHLKEIEEHLYCPQRWKQNKDTYKKKLHSFEQAIQNRERLITSTDPQLPSEPDYDQILFPTAPKKRPYLHIFLFFCAVIFPILFWSFDLDFLNSLVYSLLAGAISPFLIQLMENRIYHWKTDEALQRQLALKATYTLQVQQIHMRHAHEKEQLIKELSHGEHLFLTESFLGFDQKNKSTRMKDRVLIKSKIYDDQIRYEMDEETKSCYVILKLPKETLPPYIVIGHKYHLLRLVGQMLILEQYFPDYKIRGLLHYKNNQWKKRIYTLDYKSVMAFQKAFDVVSRGVQTRAIDNIYRCVHCPLKTTCRSIKKEAIYYLEQHPY